ncbi:uncharacterized protein [Chironomus tepperi]|uniref:uncharacterized protein n=1 Tax=Chironomus tepperi TaxID=113505 RepID=UPI00391FA374
MIKLILCVFAAIKLASGQSNGIIWDSQPQYQPQYPQQHYQPQIQSNIYREAAEEPVVGSPLLPILAPRVFPLGLPGLRFSNLNAGHLGGLMYGHSLLGSPNPMADEQAEAQYQSNAELQVASPYQADPQIAAQYDQSSYGHHGKKWWWKKWANDDQSGSIIGAAPCSCAQSYQNYQVASPQSYSGYEAAPQGYEVASPQEFQVDPQWKKWAAPQSYDVASPQEFQVDPQWKKWAAPQSYDVAAPQNFKALPAQVLYNFTQYLPAIPQNSPDLQPNPVPEYRAPYDYTQIQPQPAGPIIQPAGTYESAEKSAADPNDERSWDWSWKGDKKAGIKDKFYGKKDKFNKGGHAHPTQHYHQHVYGYHEHKPTYYHEPEYKQPIYTKPVYTKPAPVPTLPVQYNNYYGGYQARNMEAEQQLNAEVKSEVGQSHDLKITTTEASSSNKTATTTASCYSPNELTTKSTTTTNEKNAMTVSTTTEKSKKKKNNDDKPKTSSRRRRRREVLSPSTNAKRCISLTDPIFLGSPALPSFHGAPALPTFPGAPLFGTGPLLGAPNPNAAGDDSTQDQVSNPSDNCERYETVKKGLCPTKIQTDNVPQETRLQFQAVPPANGIKSFFDKMSLPIKSDKLIHGNILGDTNESLDAISEASESVQVDENNVGVPYSGDDNLGLPQSQDASQYLPQSTSQDANDPVVGAPNIGPISFASSSFGVTDNMASNVRYDMSNMRNSINVPSFNRQSHQAPCRCNYENYNNLINRIQSSYQHFQTDMSEIFEQFKAAESSRSKGDSDTAPTINPDMDYNVVCSDVNAVGSSPEMRKLCHEFKASSFNVPASHHNSVNNLHRNDYLSYQDYIRMVTNVNANPNTLVSSSGPDYPIVGAPNPTSSDPETDERSNTVKLIKEYIKDLPDESPIVGAANPEVTTPEKVTEQVLGQANEVKPKPSIRDQILNLLDEFKQKNRRI